MHNEDTLVHDSELDEMLGMDDEEIEDEDMEEDTDEDEDDE
jgi:hypothetical protein